MNATKGIPVDLWTWSSNPADELRRTGSLILYAEKPNDAPSPRRVTVSAKERAVSEVGKFNVENPR